MIVLTELSKPIKDHPKRIVAHFVGLLVLAYIYIAWAYLGYRITSKYGYYFFNHNKVGYKYAGIATLMFAALAEIGIVSVPNKWDFTLIILVFIFGWILTALKEYCTEKNEKNSGYQSLPQ